MDAVLDIGNTRVKLGYFENGQLTDIISFPSNPISGIYRQLEGKLFDNCILSSVIDLPSHIISYMKGKAKKIIVLDENTPLPVGNKYATPGTLGADRMGLAAAAATMYPGANILAVSLGTCVTYNIVTSEGVYEGGAISPGMHMRLQAMHSFTAKLPLLQPEQDVDVAANTTKSAMLAGAIRGLVFEIEGFARELAKKYKDLQLILSGGDSRYVAGMFSIPLEVQPDLAITGLYKILMFNVKKAK